MELAITSSTPSRTLDRIWPVIGLASGRGNGPRVTSLSAKCLKANAHISDAFGSSHGWVPPLRVVPAHVPCG